MRRFASWRGLVTAMAAVAILVAPIAAATPGANTSYSYDSLGRVIRVVIDNGGTNGLTTITYSYDPAGNRTAVVSTTGTNTGPTAVADAISTAKNVAVIFDPRTNDTDPENQYLTITSTGTPTSGTVAINSSGLLTYTPANNFTGTATFTYTISDGSLTSTATDTMTVTNGPAANGDSITVQQDTPYNFDPRANDSAPSGMTLTITAVGPASHGWAVVASGGTSVTYTPAAGYYGTDTFTYTVSDGHGGTASATVSATVLRPPLAAPDSVITQVNVAKTFDPRTNDSDPQGYSLTITGTGTAGHGTVTNNGGVSLTYTPTTSYQGPDSFSYTISNGHGGTASATVSVAVNAVQPPVANPDSKVTVTNAPVTLDPRVNDTDPQGYPLTITLVGTPSHGGAVINSGTSVTYTPTTGYTGADSFSYTISNGVLTASSTVSITVNSYSPPTANPDSMDLEFDKNDPLFQQTIDPRVNDISPSGLPLTVTAVTQGTWGTVTFTGTSVTYTFNGGHVATSKTDSFNYTISDGQGGTSTATVSVVINIYNGN